jgi:hypothetical protein
VYPVLDRLRLPHLLEEQPGAARYDDEGLGTARLVVVAERVADDL